MNYWDIISVLALILSMIALANVRPVGTVSPTTSAGPKPGRKVVDLLKFTIDGYEDIFDKKPVSVVMNRETRRQFVTEMTYERRYVNMMRYDNGEQAIEYDGVPVFSKLSVPEGEVWALPVKPWEI